MVCFRDYCLLLKHFVTYTAVTSFCLSGCCTCCFYCFIFHNCVACWCYTFCFAFSAYRTADLFDSCFRTRCFCHNLSIIPPMVCFRDYFLCLNYSVTYAAVTSFCLSGCCACCFYCFIFYNCMTFFRYHFLFLKHFITYITMTSFCLSGCCTCCFYCFIFYNNMTCRCYFFCFTFSAYSTGNLLNTFFCTAGFFNNSSCIPAVFCFWYGFLCLNYGVTYAAVTSCRFSGLFACSRYRFISHNRMNFLRNNFYLCFFTNGTGNFLYTVLGTSCFPDNFSGIPTMFFFRYKLLFFDYSITYTAMAALCFAFDFTSRFYCIILYNRMLFFRNCFCSCFLTDGTMINYRSCFCTGRF